MNPDEEKEKFYEDLECILNDTPFSENHFILGDFNAPGGGDHDSSDNTVWERKTQMVHYCSPCVHLESRSQPTQFSNKGTASK